MIILLFYFILFSYRFIKENKQYIINIEKLIFIIPKYLVNDHV